MANGSNSAALTVVGAAGGAATEVSSAVVLTSMDVLVFPRATGESWASAFTRLPQHLETISLPQAEAVCFAGDGGIFVTTEGEHAPLVRYQLAK